MKASKASSSGILSKEQMFDNTAKNPEKILPIENVFLPFKFEYSEGAKAIKYKTRRLLI